jgi:hypothetical protein
LRLGIGAMTQDADKHRRRSIRLRGYDYAQAGAYFVTIVTKDRACLFGDVVNGEIRLNDSGGLIHSMWEELPDHYPGVERDAFVVMPNHIHGVVVLVNDVGAGPRACPAKETGQPQGGLAAVRWSVVAAQLLRTHRARRKGTESHPGIHRKQSAAMGDG